MLVLLLLHLACATPPRTAANPAPSASPPSPTPVASPAPPTPEHATNAAPGHDPGLLRAADLYAACAVRVEGANRSGECVTDADCVAAGCSSEACLARADRDAAPKTCEILPCFAVLDACGCREGVCAWSIVPAPAPMALPPRP